MGRCLSPGQNIVIELKYQTDKPHTDGIMSIGPGHPHPIQFGPEAVLHLDQGVENPLTELIERLTETFLLHPLQPMLRYVPTCHGWVFLMKFRPHPWNMPLCVQVHSRISDRKRRCERPCSISRQRTTWVQFQGKPIRQPVVQTTKKPGAKSRRMRVIRRALRIL